MVPPNHSKPVVASAPKRSTLDPWALDEYSQVASTNLVAATLPAWSVVRADIQTAGRGRFQREWVSDEGGLWMSAVLPFSPELIRLAPLAAGLAVCQALRAFGISTLRLRWPNDVLVGSRKLAGLLVDQFTPGLAVAGIGINVRNHPERCDALLRGEVVRLADLVSPAPGLTVLLKNILDRLHAVCRTAESDPDRWLEEIHPFWQAPRPVQLDLDGRTLAGEFQGVDPRGRLVLTDPSGTTKFFEPHQVRLLRDI